MANISEINGYGINAVSASYALTASFALNGGGGAAFPYTGSAVITGSLIVTGSTTSTLGFTGSLQGTASFATTASFALAVAGGLYTLTQSVPGTVVTSGTPVISLTATIPANTIGSSGTIEFIAKFFGAGGTGIGSLYVNTSNTIVGASLLATGTSGFPSAGFGMLARTMNYTGSLIRTLTAASNFPSDYTSTGISSVSFNPAVTNYFLFTVTNGPAYAHSYRITIY